MITLRHASTTAALLRGADHLLVLGSEAALKGKARHPGLDGLSPEVQRLVAELLKDLSPGLGGAAAGTLCSEAPRRVAVGVLPNEVSRHNAPARAEAIRSCMVKSNTGKRGKGAVLLLLDDAEHQLAATLAVARALPLYDGRSQVTKPRPSCAVHSVGPDGRSLRASKVVTASVESLREAARLVDLPPSELDPAAFQREARRLVKGIKGVRTRAIVGKDLLAAGCGGIHGVGRCANSAPRLIVMTWAPARPKGHIALVGKGITYDTGGLSLKVGGGMVGMKSDMGGAAAVLGAFRTLASTGCRSRVSALLCLAENAIGPDAFKNDDILTLHSGMRVEINNTDAEGRLVLADGVSFAARKLKAEIVLDAATLTGAQLVATGRLHAGLLAGDEDLEDALVAAGRHTGELVHPMPFAPEFHRKEFASKVADFRNSVADRMNAQSSCAGEFIRWQLDGTKARYGHVDMAGPSTIGGRGSGFGPALLAEAVRRLA